MTNAVAALESAPKKARKPRQKAAGAAKSASKATTTLAVEIDETRPEYAGFTDDQISAKIVAALEAEFGNAAPAKPKRTRKPRTADKSTAAHVTVDCPKNWPRHPVSCDHCGASSPEYGISREQADVFAHIHATCTPGKRSAEVEAWRDEFVSRNLSDLSLEHVGERKFKTPLYPSVTLTQTQFGAGFLATCECGRGPTCYSSDEHLVFERDRLDEWISFHSKCSHDSSSNAPSKPTKLPKPKGQRSPRKGHTLTQLRKLKESDFYNPDTGTELNADEATEHLWELEQNRADKLVAQALRQPKPMTTEEIQTLLAFNGMTSKTAIVTASKTSISVELQSVVAPGKAIERIIREELDRRHLTAEITMTFGEAAKQSIPERAIDGFMMALAILDSDPELRDYLGDDRKAIRSQLAVDMPYLTDAAAEFAIDTLYAALNRPVASVSPVAEATPATEIQTAPVKRPRGRPRKVIPESEVVQAPRKRGRPKTAAKELLQAVARKRGRPKKNAVQPTAA